ncbi:hypothetical protein HPB51_028494 [Rhipicephalus microplus]|uniref:Uncharacterized protein n=1 Tax=Rhipicephalus microplus TaxID=6941 RepID=A0A9J6CX77_RHIMP|nr:hypothetical protein HPB51_028494 [Rhipicephalus microplus]
MLVCGRVPLSLDHHGGRTHIRWTLTNSRERFVVLTLSALLLYISGCLFGILVSLLSDDPFLHHVRGAWRCVVPKEDIKTCWSGSDARQVTPAAAILPEAESALPVCRLHASLLVHAVLFKVFNECKSCPWIMVTSCVAYGCTNRLKKGSGLAFQLSNRSVPTPSLEISRPRLVLSVLGCATCLELKIFLKTRQPNCSTKTRSFPHKKR